MKIEKIDELLALRKALFFIKFVSEDTEAHYLAGSPILGSLLEKINEELQPFLVKKGIKSETFYGYIEKHNSFIDAIKRHTKNILHWDELDKDAKVQTIKTLASPYEIKNETIMNIISEPKN